MSNKKRFKKIVDFIDKNTEADDYVINYEFENKALSRFANNMLTQNLDRDDEKLDLTLYFGKKKGNLTTSDLSESKLKNLIKKCEKIAKNSVEDKEYVPSVGDKREKSKDMIDEAVLEMKPEDRIELANIAIKEAKKNKVKVFGTSYNGIKSYGVATKNGLFDYYSKTDVGFTNTVDFKDEKGASFLNGYNKKTVDKDAVKNTFNEASNDAKMLENRKEFEPGRYKIVLSSKAATKLLIYLGFYGSNRRAVDEGYSPLTGKMNKKIMDERINIYTDPYYKKAPSKPFTEEGMKIDKKYMVKNGVLEDVPCGRFWAKKNNYNPWSISNVIIDDGEKSEEELIKNVDKGFYIKDLWYIRMVRMEDFTLTGMTRNGFFYIEDGKIASGATHFRWNDSPIRMLNNIEDLGKGSSVINNWYSIYAPSMVVNDFYLSSKTLF